MRIAFLETAPPEPDFAARFGSWVARFTALLDDPACELAPYDAWRGELPAPGDAVDAYLIPGGLASANDDVPWIHRLLDHLRAVHAAGLPLVGICFGHQLIARALGGEVAPHPHVSASPPRPDRGFALGVHPVRWLAGPLARRAPTRVYMSHQDEVCALPPGAELLATSDHARVQAFRVGRTLGIQGHPELDAQVARHFLAKNSIGVDAATVARADESLTGDNDHAVVGRFVRDWLTDTLPAP